MSSPSQPLAVIAKLLDLTERRVQQLSREGVIPKAERGRYDLVGAVRGYVAYLREQARAAEAGAPDYAAERARLLRAKADLAEMEAGGRRGELIPGAQVEAAWTAVLARLRQRLLGLPDRLAPLCHEETTIAGARDPNLARDAVYVAGGDEALLVRVVERRPDMVSEFGGGRIASATAVFDLCVSDVAVRRPGDRIELGDEAFFVQGEPRRDAARLVWTLDTRPA